MYRMSTYLLIKFKRKRLEGDIEEFDSSILLEDKN